MATLAPKTFFSFSQVTHPRRHGDFNAWHQLDHRPENLALDGVFGERWVRSPDCASASVTDGGTLAGFHYLTLYWFRPPLEETIARWQDLDRSSYQWGRRPESDWVTRPLLGFFTTVKGYVSPRVLVSTCALPYRPTTGVHVTVSRMRERFHPETERLYAWHDRVRIPEALELPGVAGAYTFASETTTLDAEWRPDAKSATGLPAPGSANAVPGQLRITVLFLDGDPIVVARQLAEQEASLESDVDPSQLEERLFSGPLKRIDPWQWDWFDVNQRDHEREGG